MAVTARPSCSGYSLLEVVLVIGMSTLIVGGMALALQSQERAYRAQGSGHEELQSVDLAVSQLQQDLQLAGAGLPPGTLPAVAPGPGNGKPVLTIRYLTDDPFVTRLTAPATDQSRLFRISPKAISRFRKGDQVLVHNDGKWLAFRVADVQSRSSPGLRPAPDTLSSADGAPFRLTFPQGSEVVRLRDAEVQYVLARGKAWDGRLVRRHGTHEAVVAVDVQDLNVDYLVVPPDGVGQEWTPTPPGDTSVLGIRVRLAVGRTAVRFTVTPRNLSRKSLS